MNTPHTELSAIAEQQKLALLAVNRISAMVAYWDNAQRCAFSNDACRKWFGKAPDAMIGITMHELLGPLYELNLPFILGALSGAEQVFERRIPLSAGGYRDSIATYTPDIDGDVVKGFWVHVTDVTALRKREAELERALKERDESLDEAKSTLHGLLPICLGCKSIRDAEGRWHNLEKYVSEHSHAQFSHGLCPDCFAKQSADLE